MKPAWPRLTWPANPHDDVEPEHGDEQDEGDHQRAQHAAFVDQQRQRDGHDQGRHATEPRAASVQADDAAIGTQFSADVVAAQAARDKQTLRPPQQGREQQAERQRVAEQRRDVARGELFGDTKETGHRRPRPRANSCRRSPPR
ncbi:MAG: hypothetical protein WDO24_17690 [Pseudomonadota bacterium]